MTEADAKMIDQIEDPAVQTRIAELITQLTTANADIERLSNDNKDLAKKYVDSTAIEGCLEIKLTATKAKVEKLRCIIVERLKENHSHHGHMLKVKVGDCEHEDCMKMNHALADRETK